MFQCSLVQSKIWVTIMFAGELELVELSPSNILYDFQ